MVSTIVYVAPSKGAAVECARWCIWLVASAIRKTGPLRCFYEGLVSRGKPRQLSLIAVAHKLLLAFN